MPAQRLKFAVDLLPAVGAKPKFLTVRHLTGPNPYIADVVPASDLIDDDDTNTDPAKPAKLVWICASVPKAGGILDFFNAAGHTDDSNDEVLKIVDLNGAKAPTTIFKNKKIFNGAGVPAPVNPGARLLVRVDHDPAVGTPSEMFKYTLRVRWRANAGAPAEFFTFDPMINNLGRF